MNPHGPTARRFPLVARFRPVCLPLAARVGKLAELADRAARDANTGEASSVFNQAALLASDLNLPDLARSWCHQHAHLYLNRCPLTTMDAIRALEPLVNLARLHIRAGQPARGYELLVELRDAVTNHTAITVDEITVPDNLLTAHTDHRELHQWLWRVLLADATRALTSGGQWRAALHHLQQHAGVGHHMLDGRQVAIIASAIDGDYQHAQHLLATTAPGEAWENAVTACLTILCRPPDSNAAPNQVDDLVTRFRLVGFSPNTAVFHTRLALSVLDADPHHTPATQHLIRDLADLATTAGDGHAAADLLAHHRCTQTLRPDQTQRLAQIVNTSGLGSATMPPEVMAQVQPALTSAREVLLDAAAVRVAPAPDV